MRLLLSVITLAIFSATTIIAEASGSVASSDHSGLNSPESLGQQIQQKIKGVGVAGIHNGVQSKFLGTTEATNKESQGASNKNTNGPTSGGSTKEKRNEKDHDEKDEKDHDEKDENDVGDEKEEKKDKEEEDP